MFGDKRWAAYATITTGVTVTKWVCVVCCGMREERRPRQIVAAQRETVVVVGLVLRMLTTVTCRCVERRASSVQCRVSSVRMRQRQSAGEDKAKAMLVSRCMEEGVLRRGTRGAAARVKPYVRGRNRVDIAVGVCRRNRMHMRHAAPHTLRCTLHTAHCTLVLKRTSDQCQRHAPCVGPAPCPRGRC